MKSQHCFFYFSFILLVSCHNEGRQEISGKKSNRDSVMNEEAKTDPAALQSLYHKLPEVHLPAKINIVNDNPGQLLSDEELQKILPEYKSDSSGTKVYAIAKISLGNCNGILYYFSTPTHEADETEPREISTINLYLYNASFEYSDQLQLAISDYGSGWVFFRSADDITYLHEAEMEFINLEIVKYKIRGNKFEEAGEKILKEFSGEKYYDKYEAYIKNLEEGFISLGK